MALWLTSDLDQGTLNAMGPAMLPRWLAVAVGLSGLALVAFAFAKPGDALERWSLRGPVFVIGAILAFALTNEPGLLQKIRMILDASLNHQLSGSGQGRSLSAALCRSAYPATAEIRLRSASCHFPTLPFYRPASQLYEIVSPTSHVPFRN